MRHQPSALVRVTLIVLLPLAAGRAGQVGTPLPYQDHELPHLKKHHQVDVTSARHAYTISMGGTVDMDHAMTREYATWHIGWQPNESLTIANTGRVPVENVKLIVNDRGDWYTLEGLLQEAVGSAKTNQEKVYLVWQFARSNRHHDDPLFEGPYGDELHDPVKMIAMYGGGLCDDSGSIGASMANALGLNPPRPFVRGLHGHMMCEVRNQGRWQFMDIDENVFYLDRENELPVGGDAVARDHDLAHREAHYGPIFRGWQTGRSGASLFGRDDSRHRRLVSGYKIRVCLRPDERIEYRWDNIGKWSMRLPTRGRRWVGNSRKIYEPDLGAPTFGAESIKRVAAKPVDGKPAAVARDPSGELVYRMSSAWVLCGGRVNATFKLRSADDKAAIEVWAKDNVTVDGKTHKTEPITVWQATGPGVKQADVEVDKAINVIHGRPDYEFFVRFRLDAAGQDGSAALTNLAIRGDIMVSPIFLPRLRLGKNKVVYTDDTDKPGKRVRVTYRWRETTATKTLPAPKPTYPPAGKAVRDEILTYAWRPVPGAKAYHLQVARDPALRWPYRPSLDVVYDKGCEFAVPFWGIYAPDTTYYWRVRTQNDKGIWGDWSNVQTFTWVGPRVPVDLKLTEADGAFTLSWKPNPKGQRPVRYEVYASDIKGFSVSKEPYEVPKLGKVPANDLGRTTGTSMIVGGWRAATRTPQGVTSPANLNRCYYRVVAVDAKGTHSGCSDYAEMPHPHIWTQPPTGVRIGQAYRYEPQSIRDLGDLQHRYEKPGQAFWEKERLSYALTKAPAWLKIDATSGAITGTPPTGSAGKHQVRLRVTATFEPRTGKDTFTKDLPPRHAEQAFELSIEE